MPTARLLLRVASGCRQIDRSPCLPHASKDSFDSLVAQFEPCHGEEEHVRADLPLVFVLPISGCVPAKRAPVRNSEQIGHLVSVHAECFFQRLDLFRCGWFVVHREFQAREKSHES